MAGPPERWSVDAGTRDVARLDIPADALHERTFELDVRALVRERAGAAGGHMELTVKVDGALEWQRRVLVEPGSEDNLDLRLKRTVAVGRPLKIVAQCRVKGLQRVRLTISAEQTLPDA